MKAIEEFEKAIEAAIKTIPKLITGIWRIVWILRHWSLWSNRTKNRYIGTKNPKFCFAIQMDMMARVE